MSDPAEPTIPDEAGERLEMLTWAATAWPQHDNACDEWCNHCTACGASILYGSLCPDHYNRPGGNRA